LEIVEDFERANKQAGINRIVLAQVFPNSGDFVSARSDFHRVIYIENGIELSIHCDIEHSGIRIIKQSNNRRVVETMITHREKKRSADVACDGKKRDAILLSPVAIFDEQRVHTGRNELLELLNHALALVSDHEVDGFDLCMDQGVQSVRNQRPTKHRDEWFQ